jgi:hypothetical protein
VIRTYLVKLSCEALLAEMRLMKCCASGGPLSAILFFMNANALELTIGCPFAAA